MRRFVTLAFLFLFSIPFGISIAGCGKKGTSVVYCDSTNSGPIVGQVNTITLTPRIYGISLNEGQIGQVATPQATDCKGTPVTLSTYTYGVFDATGHQNNDLLQIADVVPSGANAGRICGGNWNRNTGGGIPDFTTCNVTGKGGLVYVVASGGGATSNALPVFIHPKVTSVVLGNPTTACAATDGGVESANQSSNCCALSKQATVTASPYDGASCISQGDTRQLVGRAYDSSGNNVTCQVGHLNFAAQSTGSTSSNIATIDENGIATAQQPGSTIITADLTQAGSSAGFFSTCPPVNISLTVPGTNAGVTSVTVPQNTTQPLSATATDKNGKTMTGLSLTFVSTTPITIPVSSTGSITPPFPGAASITALCQPPACNISPQNTIGRFGNGKPVVSNAVSVTTPGINSTLLWASSTQSRYIYPIDFTNQTVGAPVRLPFAPNSMVISNDGASIYMGTPTELMVFSATTNSLLREDPSVAGRVLAVSPDGANLIIADPRKKLIYLYSASSTATTGVLSTYGGAATHAEFTQDSQTVYITMGTPGTADPSDPNNPPVTPNDQLLVHSTFNGWTQVSLNGNVASDVAITVPTVGAYLAGATTIGRTYCSSTTTSGSGASETVVNNLFFPQADSEIAATDRIAATNDGLHILGASATSGQIADITFSQTLPPAPPTNDPENPTPNPTKGSCPTAPATDYFHQFRSALNTPSLGVTADTITGVLPTPNSSVAFVTYTGSGTLPAYTPSTGTVTQVTLSGGATAPVAGVISVDGTTAYIGTSGDNQIHLVDTKSLTETQTPINPKLPKYDPTTLQDAPTTYVTPNLLVQFPRKATS